MIFFSHSSRIRILQLTVALVCSCSEGLLTIMRGSLRLLEFSGSLDILAFMIAFMITL